MEEFSDKSISDLEDQISSPQESVSSIDHSMHRRSTKVGTSDSHAGYYGIDAGLRDYDDEENDYDMASIISSFVWLLYASFPLLSLVYLTFCRQFSVSLVPATLLQRFSTSSITGEFYKPDLPSGYSSESGNYDDYKIEFYDLEDYSSSAEGWNNEERVLFCVPLRDAANHLPMFFGNMRNLTYPHNLIDLAFLISDTTDTTIRDLKRHLKEIQSDEDESMHFGRINIYEKDFGQVIGQSFSDRHGFAAQGPRRKLMAIARNWLLSTTLRPDHSWVYWRDADVETVPATIIEDLMHHDKDVIVPNIWRPLPDWLGYEQPYDLNSWQESVGGLELADRLDEDAVIVEGYSEYATWRPHLAYLRDAHGDPEVEMELDGIGGVSILSKAKVFKHGAMFPAFSYQKHAETEGFGKLCKTMNFSVIGLPHYTIWHIYEPSAADIKHMKWMAEEETNKVERAKLQKFYDRIWKKAFEEVNQDWQKLKFDVFKNTDTRRSVDIDWSEVDEYLIEMEQNPEMSSIDDFNKDGDNNEDDKGDDGIDDSSSDLSVMDNIYRKSDKLEKFLLKKLRAPNKGKGKATTQSSITRKAKNGKEYTIREERYNSFPLNQYLSDREGKNYKFVKFSKNNVINSQQNREKYSDGIPSDIDDELEFDFETTNELHRAQGEAKRIEDEQERIISERERLMNKEAAKRVQLHKQLERELREQELRQAEELQKLKEIADAKKKNRAMLQEEKNRQAKEAADLNHNAAIQKELERKRKQQKQLQEQLKNMDY